MQKKIFLLASACLLISLWAHQAQAQVFTIIDPEPIKNSYAGSVILVDNGFDKQYWYISPKAERYSLDEVEDLQKITATWQAKVTTAQLNKLATSPSSEKVDYNLAHSLQGKFLQAPDKKIWYLNPIDDIRYQITLDNQGLDALKNLALDFSADRLVVLPQASDDNFVASTSTPNFNLYWQVRDILKRDFYKATQLNDKNLFYGSLEGLAAASEDPYTQFFTPQDKKSFDDTLASAVEGIGAQVDIKNGLLTIISPLDDSPAQKAGLLPNDQVLMVNGTDISGYTLDQGVNLIKGKAGTPVTLKIYRPNNKTTFEVTIIRARINLINVSASQLSDNIGYIKINMFTQNLLAEFNQVKNIAINKNTRGLVIDLRNNPGGYTDSALALADLWLPRGKLIMQEKFPDYTSQYYAEIDPSINLPTVILINNGTASASEIFTSALRENNIAKTVGQTSFGKGTGQSMTSFTDGSALKYTIFEWLTPSGRSVSNTGLKPDYEIGNLLDSATDNQLNKALELLK
ncbi:MAG: S41 family peptidase [Patescibacteria group bacterium]